ncbi:MAG: lipoprotein signal peptidase [Tannerella sp.]|jgi:signal peptidase II|nr:lipoprotein signal peptidase [Tannerella sp.]
MQSKHRKAWGAAAIAVLLLILDQTLKIWVKTHMQLHESIHLFSWFQLYFTENPGMAFGMELLDKWILSVFRIVAVTAIGYYIFRLIRRNVSFGYIACIALIFAGAVGNIIDSLFYGVIFDHSYGQLATFLPEGGGYATLLHGKVVDMLYFPLIRTHYPEWFPLWSGEEFIFFRPIFNLADSAICVGVAILLLFYRRQLSDSFSK